MSILPLPILRVAAAILTAVLMGLGPARADTTIALGDGVSLTYRSGMLDPISLEGSAEGVRLLAGGEPVLAIARLRLVTAGALVDPDFTLVEFEAQGIADGGGPLLTEATGRDVPVGALRTLARAFAGRRVPALDMIVRGLDGITLGALTLSGFEDRDGSVVTKVGRISIQGIEKGNVKQIEIEDCELADEAVPIRNHLRSARIRGLWMDQRAVAEILAEGFSMISNDFNLSIAALTYRSTAALAAGGALYFPDSNMTISDVTVRPGRAPAAGVTAVFAGLGEEGLRLQFTGRSTMLPDGADLAMSTSMSLAAQTGDTITISVLGQGPLNGWQRFNDAFLRSFDGGADDAQMADAAKLIHGEIAVTAGRLANGAIDAAARDSGLSPTAMRKVIAEKVATSLRVLPGGGAAFREAASRFFLRSGTLSLVFSPHQPVPLASLLTANEKNIVGLFEQLNVSLSHSAP